MQCLVASRQYSHAVSSHGGGVGRLLLFVTVPEEASSWRSLARSTRNGRNVSTRVWWYTNRTEAELADDSYLSR